MSRKVFCSKTGFLLHVVETCDIAAPHAQGLFLSLLSTWQPGGDEEVHKAHSPGVAGLEPEEDLKDMADAFRLAERQSEEDATPALDLELLLDTTGGASSNVEPPTACPAPQLTS